MCPEVHYWMTLKKHNKNTHKLDFLVTCDHNVSLLGHNQICRAFDFTHTRYMFLDIFDYLYVSRT